MKTGFYTPPVYFGRIRELSSSLVKGQDAVVTLKIDNSGGKKDAFRFRDLMGAKGTVQFYAAQEGQIFEIIRDEVRSPLRTAEELAQCKVLIPVMPVSWEAKINVMKALVNAGFFAILIHSLEEIRQMYESVGIPEDEIQQLLSEFCVATEFSWVKSRLH